MVVLKTGLDFVLDYNGELFNTVAEGDNTRSFINFVLKHFQDNYDDNLMAYWIIESMSDIEFLEGGCVSVEIDFNQLMSISPEAVERLSTFVNDFKYK